MGGSVRKMSSPRSGDGASPRTPSALRNELAAAKRAVEVLKAERQNSDDKLEKLHAVLEKERNALREVLSAARVKVDELEKLKKEQAEEIERLRRLLEQQQANQSNSEQITILEQQIITLKTTITNLETELRTAQTAITERDSTIVDLRTTISTLQTQAGGASDHMKTISELKTELLALQGNISEKDQTIDDLRKQLTTSQGAQSGLADKDQQISDLQHQLTEMRSQLAVSRENTQTNALSTDSDRLQKQLADLRESLSSTQTTMREQVDTHRSRESQLRDDLAKQRQESISRIQDLEKQLREAMQPENAQLLDRLQKQVVSYRQHASLRMFNAILQRHHLVMGACMFWSWVLTTKDSALQKRLQADYEFKLSNLKMSLTPGLSGPFAHTPLLHTTHLATRSLGTPQRFDKWETMSPRSGTGDGACTLSPRSSRSGVTILPTARGGPSMD